MAKYCMFCGNQLPDIAQFCAKCGQKQPDPEPEEYEEKIEDTEDASDEMDLLSQFGFVSTPKPQKKKTPPFQPTTVKKEEPKQEVKKEIPKQEVKQEVKQEEIKQEIKHEEPKQEVVQEKPKQDPPRKPAPQKPVGYRNQNLQSLFDMSSMDINVVETPVTTPVKTEPESQSVIVDSQKENMVLTTEKTDPIERPEHNRRQSSRRQDSAVPFKPTEIKKSENAMPVASDSKAQYDLPEDFNISTDADSEPDTLSQEEIEKEKQLKKEFEERKKSSPNEVESISAKKQRNSKFTRKKRTVSEESEEEEFKTELTSRNGASSMMSENTLYADEVKAQELHEESKDMDEDDDAPRRKRTSEGRKQVNNNAQKRKRSSRDSDINKKIYKIEHDKSQLDPEEQEYDGYYENVLPLDHDTLQKAKIDPKIILIGLGVVAMIGLAVFIILKTLGL